ncbi:hypothetical protein D3C87_587710 [compost metagenome]
MAEKLSFLGYSIVYVDVTGFHELCRFYEPSHMSNLNSYGFLCLEEIVWFAQDFVSVLRRNSHEDEHFLGIKNSYGEIIHVDNIGLDFAAEHFARLYPYESEVDAWLTYRSTMLGQKPKET